MWLSKLWHVLLIGRGSERSFSETEPVMGQGMKTRELEWPDCGGSVGFPVNHHRRDLRSWL